jgi:phosphoribosylformimino-5-aminoimidazole carboxamide ribonucleotide (ProFAR) isomerase
VIASGGVHSLSDLSEIALVEADGRGPVGAIVGMALVEGLFSVEEALARCEASG